MYLNLKILGLCLIIGVAGWGCFFNTSGITSEDNGFSDLFRLDSSLGVDSTPPHDIRPTCNSCPLRCNMDTNRCNLIKPSNFAISGFILHCTGDIIVDGNMQIDTDTGEIKDGNKTIRPANTQGPYDGIYWKTVPQSQNIPQSPNIPLSVFCLSRLHLPAGKTITIKGKQAFALYAHREVNLEGKILAVAYKKTAGPGGYAGGDAGSNGVSCFGGEGENGSRQGSSESGGGGGGRNTKGGDGGDSDEDFVGGDGGDVVIGSETLTPLFGGCGGGGGGPNGGAGGGGGGAIQITTNGTFTLEGIINVAGAGGLGGQRGSGGGGGSGGAVLVEAVSMTGNGKIFANGGGGGSGGGKDIHHVKNGDPGQESINQAHGGEVNGQDGGGGGNGGAISLPEKGDEQTNAGGGGGAAGRIHINVKNPSPKKITETMTFSPTPSINNNVSTW